MCKIWLLSILIFSLFVHSFASAKNKKDYHENNDKKEKNTNKSALVERVSMLWNKFWSSSCQYSSVVSRSRRSVPEQPKSRNARELFHYMFPLAHVQAQDFVTGRSASGPLSPPSLAVYLDDILDIWQQGCKKTEKQQDENHHKKSDRPTTFKKRSLWKRSSIRNQGTALNEESMNYWRNQTNANIARGFHTPITMTTTYPPLSSQEEEEAEEEETTVVSVSEEEEDESVEDEYKSTKTTTTENPEAEKVSEKPKEQEEEEEEDEETTTTTTTLTPLSVIPPDSGQEYFASYGGDIEYVYPLITFTVPFDGEITILGGYHGFNGLATY